MNTEAIAGDVRTIFQYLRDFFAGKPEAPDESPFPAVADWLARPRLERDADFDTKHGRMSAVRFVGALPPGIEPGEVVAMTEAEARHFAGIGLVEIVHAQAGAYQPDA